MRKLLFVLFITLFAVLACNDEGKLPQNAESLIKQAVNECRLYDLFICGYTASQKGTDPTAALKNISNENARQGQTYDEVWCVILRNMDTNTYYRALYYRNHPSIITWLQPVDERLIYPVADEDFASVGCSGLPQIPKIVSLPAGEISEAEAIEFAKTYLEGEAERKGTLLTGAELMTYLESFIRLDRIARGDLSQEDAEAKVWVIGFKNEDGIQGAQDIKAIYVIMRASDGGHIINYLVTADAQVEIAPTSK